MSYDVPIALILFRRPQLTERVFRRIAEVRPRRLLLIADGPRLDVPGEAEKCAAARAVVERVDWDCDVLRNYSDVNLGCGKRPATGIDWVFEQVEEAILFEDDCVPDPTFFPFCEEMLARHRDDGRVIQVSGFTMPERPRGKYSYFFSRYNLCSGGWATWRRAWRHMDMEMSAWPELRGTSFLADIHANPRAVEYWTRIFDEAYRQRGDVDYWDYQWTFNSWAQSGLSVIPEVGLLKNVGYGDGATHTQYAAHRDADLPTGSMEFPLRHPPVMVRDLDADRQFFEHRVSPAVVESFYARARRRLRGLIPGHVRRPLSGLRSRITRPSGS